MTGPAPCPICRKPATAEFTPFCSRRCADIDLGRWFTGEYRIAAIESDQDEENMPPPDKGA